MNAVDTNVLVYRFDELETEKHATAQALIEELVVGGETILPWQVACELLNQLTYWHRQNRIQRSDILEFATEVRLMFPLVMPTPNCLDRALELASRFSLSHWDSMLLAACLETGVTTLYTEDMGAPTTIDSVELINPF